MLLALGVWHGEGLLWRGAAAFLLEPFWFCPTRTRISAGGAPYLGGSAGLGNWRGSRLQTVYRGIGIGAEVGKYRASFAGLGSATLADVRLGLLGFGRRLESLYIIHMGWERTMRPTMRATTRPTVRFRGSVSTLFAPRRGYNPAHGSPIPSLCWR